MKKLLQDWAPLVHHPCKVVCSLAKNVWARRPVTIPCLGRLRAGLYGEELSSQPRIRAPGNVTDCRTAIAKVKRPVIGDCYAPETAIFSHFGARANIKGDKLVRNDAGKEG